MNETSAPSVILYTLLIGDTPVSAHSTRELAQAALEICRGDWVAANPGGCEPHFLVFQTPFRG